MTRVGTRLLATLVAVALSALLLGACGGSDSDESTSTAGASTGAEANAKPKDRGGADGEQDGGGSQGSDDGDSPSQNAVGSLEVSGGGSDQFRTKGGDNSVQDYGEEGDEAELREIADIVHSFYVARIEQKWEEACSYLAKTNIEQLEQLASQSPKFEDKGCASILAAFLQPLPPSVQREATTVDAGSFRHDDEQGFLIYYGPPGKTVYSMPLRSEDGTWKVGALSGSAIG